MRERRILPRNVTNVSVTFFVTEKSHKYDVTRGNIGWSFQEQISCQNVDVTKPGGLLRAMNTDVKVLSMKTQSSLRTIQILEKCFEFKMILDYLVPGLFSTNALNSKCWKII